MAWDLERIGKEVRVITGLYSDDIQDDRLYEIIQDFWTVTFPSLVSAEFFNATYKMLTRPGISEYPFPDKFLSLSTKAVCEGSQLKVSYNPIDLDFFSYTWYQEDVSLNQGHNQYLIHNLKFPARETSLCVFTDTTTIFWGDPRIRYTPNKNNEVSIALDQPLGPSEFLIIKYKRATLQRPEWIGICKTALQLHPVPDKQYIIYIQGTQKPTPLPYVGELKGTPCDFFEFIVYGSALKVFSLLDRSGYDKLLPIYKRYEAQAMARTHKQLMYTITRGV